MRTITRWMQYKITLFFVESAGAFINFFETEKQATDAVNKSGCASHKIERCAPFPVYEKVLNA